MRSGGFEGSPCGRAGAAASLWLLLALGPAALPAAPLPPGPLPLREVKTWMFQFQDIQTPGSVEALARSAYDLLVVEPVGTYRDARSFDMKAMVDRLHAGRARRIVLAYFCLGEADEERSYWEKSWRAPGKDRRGFPEFLLKPDPDGWKETHVVQFGDPRWRALALADVRTVMAAGFDGLWLDWVEGYADPDVARELKSKGREPAQAMVDLLSEVRAEALRKNPSTLLAIQNASYLLDQDPRLPSLVDALGAEATWFRGQAEVGWADAAGGDQPNPFPAGPLSSASLVSQFARWKAAGKAVFTLDYCLKAANAKRVYERSLGLGCVPLVSRSALDRMTETPPPALR